MFTSVLRFARKCVSLLLIAVFVGYFARNTAGQQYTLPGPAAPPFPVTHLLFVTYHNVGGGSNLHLISPGN